MRIYYREGSTRYHLDKRCTTLANFEGVSFHSDVDIERGEPVPPQRYSDYPTTMLKPCAVCVTMEWSPT